jgi:hypothetical protein
MNIQDKGINTGRTAGADKEKRLRRNYGSTIN